jgi:hypothetical protein
MAALQAISGYAKSRPSRHVVVAVSLDEAKGIGRKDRQSNETNSHTHATNFGAHEK